MTINQKLVLPIIRARKDSVSNNQSNKNGEAISLICFIILLGIFALRDLRYTILYCALESDVIFCLP